MTVPTGYRVRLEDRATGKRHDVGVIATGAAHARVIATTHAFREWGWLDMTASNIKETGLCAYFHPADDRNRKKRGQRCGAVLARENVTGFCRSHQPPRARNYLG